MITTAIKTVEKELPISVTCDRCKKTQTDMQIASFIVIKADFGYFSEDGNGNSMDGDSYEATICSACFLPAMVQAGISLTKTSYFDQYEEVEE